MILSQNNSILPPNYIECSVLSAESFEMSFCNKGERSGEGVFTSEEN